MDQTSPPAILSTDKRRVLSQLLKQRGLVHTPAADLITRRPDGAPTPLSFAQQRLWFLEQFAGPGALYNISSTVRLTGRLDTAALTRALRHVVARHESLRTTFAIREGRQEQVVHASVRVDLPITDLSRLAPDQRRAAAATLAATESRRPFDLATGPLLRARLVRLAEQEHLLLIDIHHIVADGWSLAILIKEVAHHYPTDSAELPELQVHYPDFAIWQQERTAADALERQLSYWREQLTGAPTAVELPSDRPDRGRRTFAGASLPWTLPGALAERLAALARAEDATLFMVLMAGFATVVQRWSGQSDIVVGSPVANRTQAGTEGLIGFFVNMLPLRLDLSGNPTFRELLARVRECALDAYEHQDVPFDRIVEAVRPDREANGQTPFANLLLVLQNTPDRTTELPGLRMEIEALDTGTAKFDLYLQATQTPDGLSGLADYSTELFDEATVRRFVGHWTRLLSAAVAAPDTRLDALPLLTAAEQAALRSAGAARRPARPVTPLAPSLTAAFERQARLRPDAVAVSCADERTTYAELDRAANRLARTLRAHGTGPQAPVAICVAPSARLVAGILGILKSGAPYLVLDPRHSAERRARTLCEAGAAVLLADPEFAAEAAGPGRALAVLPAEPPAEMSDAPLEPRGTDPEQLACVSCGSDSEGRPLGALLTHSHVLQLIDAASQQAGFGPDDVWSFCDPSAYGDSAWGLWGALLHGGRIVVVPPEVSGDPAAFHTLVRDEGVTVLSGTSRAVDRFRGAAADANGALSLRFAVLTGDALEPTALRPWSDRRAARLYGSAQAAVQLLDARGEPVPVGVPGELCVGGPGLAWGYLGRPGLTAQHFVPSPTGDGERLRRSGDLARRTADGAIEYLGRTDQQVRVRGHRVELGAIEAEFGARPGVRQAAVVARPGPRRDSRLVAYLVLDPAAAGSVPQLRSTLREQLPDHLVPDAFVVLDALPLTADGRLDEAALPEPGTSTGPADELERMLAEIWRLALDVEQVGLDDEFFELGGHSLLAVQVVDAVLGTLGREVSIRDLFESPTLADFADAVRRAPLAGPAVAAGPAPARERLVLDGPADPAARPGPDRFDDLSDADLAALMGEAH